MILNTLPRLICFHIQFGGSITLLELKTVLLRPIKGICKINKYKMHGWKFKGVLQGNQNVFGRRGLSRKTRMKVNSSLNNPQFLI